MGNWTCRFLRCFEMNLRGTEGGSVGRMILDGEEATTKQSLTFHGHVDEGTLEVTSLNEYDILHRQVPLLGMEVLVHTGT